VSETAISCPSEAKKGAGSLSGNRLDRSLVCSLYTFHDLGEFKAHVDPLWRVLGSVLLLAVAHSPSAAFPLFFAPGLLRKAFDHASSDG